MLSKAQTNFLNFYKFIRLCIWDDEGSGVICKLTLKMLQNETFASQNSSVCLHINSNWCIRRNVKKRANIGVLCCITGTTKAWLHSLDWEANFYCAIHIKAVRLGNRTISSLLLTDWTEWRENLSCMESWELFCHSEDNSRNQHSNWRSKSTGDSMLNDQLISFRSILFFSKFLSLCDAVK